MKFLKKKIIIIGGVFLFVGIAAGWIVFFSPWQIASLGNVAGGKNPSKEEKKATEKLQGFMYKMEPFVVNLADSGLRRYLKVRIEMESNESKMNEEYEKRLPQVRDGILMILSSKFYNEIMDSEGKKKLREEIKGRVNHILQGFKAKSIFFTEFIMQ
jgi:flagellar FliL protein